MIKVDKRKYVSKKHMSAVIKNRNHLRVLAEALNISVEELLEFGRIDLIKRATTQIERLKVA